MLTQSRLKEVLKYDPETGVFTWRVSRGNHVKPREVAGCADNRGYHGLQVDSKRYPAHRLAFLYMEGYFPEHQVDHMDGVRDNNAWDNLRHATTVCNMQNTKIYSTNTSGFPGVNKERNKWRAKMKVNKKLYRLGNYSTPLEAALARYTAEVWCPEWTCNHRSKLVQAIKQVWPEFQTAKANKQPR